MLQQPLAVPIDTKAMIRTILAFAYATTGQLDQPMEIFHKRLKKPTHYMAEFTKNALNVAWAVDYRNRGRINPFVSRSYEFEDVLDVIDQVLREFGRWQDSSCTTMKSHLLGLDP